MPVEIAGRDLDACTRSDFSSAQPGSVDVRFAAALEPAAGGAAIALQDVRLTDHGTLRATVPAGLPRGVYRLRVTDPRGRAGVLQQAYRVVTPADAATGLRVEILEAPRAGVGFAVALTAVDASGNLVDGFDATVALADHTGALAPASAGPFVLGRWQLRATIPGVATGDRITATGPGGITGTSDAFDVVPGPPQAVVFPQRSVTAAAGACSPALEIELRDVLGHPSPAEAAVTAQLQAAAQGVRFFSDASCTAEAGTVAIPVGASRAAFRFRAETPGLVTVRVLPATLPSASQDETVSP